MKPKRKYTKKVKVQQPKVELPTQQNANPFEIKTDMEFFGNRTDTTTLTYLIEQVMKLEPNNSRMSVSIPLTVCKTKNDAVNLVLGLKRALKMSNDMQRVNTVVSLKAIYDVDKVTYMGSRIWRKN